MDSRTFVHLVESAITPSLGRLGFQPETPLINGRIYKAQFGSPHHVVSVSFEPGDNFLTVHVFRSVGGVLSDIDDLDETPRLSDLNLRFAATVTPPERAAADKELDGIVGEDDEARALIKVARDLRLVLPRYLAAEALRRSCT